MLGPTRADVVIGMHDSRVLALECKVSNSEVNSYKRVVHEAAGKAVQWMKFGGDGQIVPGAVLSGVFKPENLEAAQRRDLSLFWAHRLDDLRNYIDGTKA